MTDGTTLLLGGLILGLLAGLLGGMFGIGGGLVMVPAMILIFGFATKEATGTSLLAQVLPVGILGVIQYSRDGNIKLGFGLSMAFGLFIGIFVGAIVAGYMSGPLVKRLYGGFLLVCGVYLLLAPAGVKEKPKAEPIAVDAPTEPSGDQEVH